MVDKCPNCGQPSRPGARFCTSCGFRLPERPVEAETSPLTRSPFATTSTVAASWWPTSAGSGQTESAGDQPPTPDESSTPEEEPATAMEESATENAATTAETAPEPASPEPNPIADWPSSPGYEPPVDAPSSWDTQPPTAAAGTVPVEADEFAASVDELASDDAATDAGEADGQVEDLTVAEAPVWADQPESAEEPEPSPTAVAAADDGDTLARARSLLDELSALLPSLAAPAAGSAVDVAAVAAELVAARDEAGVPQDQLDSLMSIVETARARPRDIDVMLDLSRQVDAIAALKTGYDRCRGAIETALTQLGADQRG
jgi:hypothetical protein